MGWGEFGFQGDERAGRLLAGARDVRSGLVSRAQAREVYKVELDTAGEVDEVETSRLRQA